MSLEADVKIGGRFLRSVRIDIDLGDEASLDGFICPQSSADVLLSMARHIQDANQGAFTWTGPYGTGKSSLVVGLAALLSKSTVLRKRAFDVFGDKVYSSIDAALPSGKSGWKVLPVVARRGDPVEIISEAAREAGWLKAKGEACKEQNLVRDLKKVANADPKTSGGLIIFIDELGKFLEGAAQDGSDIFILQELAEAATRSGGRLIVIGVLHQSFGEYANRLTRDLRDEWAKVQGRFVDLAINTVAGEQVDLISRAIIAPQAPAHYSKLASTVAGLCVAGRPSDSKALSHSLSGCWPLHPVVSALLGPVSRRRFGQNQRSLFGFLNSAEHFGFKDFLKTATRKSLYTPDLLWDYLRVNLEPSIMGSPDGHKWALSADALERCENGGAKEITVRLLKTIAIIDLFKERSGLLPTYEFLKTCFPRVPAKELKASLAELREKSFVIFKKYQSAYAIFAGSDFDIDAATRAAVSAQPTVDFDRLRALINLQPILAKRHYHETGSLRWFDVDVVSSEDLDSLVSGRGDGSGHVGKFLMVLPQSGETREALEKKCHKAVRRKNNSTLILGLCSNSADIGEFAREFSAIEHVKNSNPDLAGDAVARREVMTRLVTIQGLLETSVTRAFDSALWFRKGQKPALYKHKDLNGLASHLADEIFPQTPIIFNELLNRKKPSGTANGAQKILMKRMIQNAGEPRLGIVGFPAEGGLYASVLEATCLYADGVDGWTLNSPLDIETDHAGLAPLWEAASDYLKTHSDRPVNIGEVFDLWSRPPFGLKKGLMPILAIAFLITTKDSLAIYHDGMFQTNFTGLDVDYLVKNPETIEVRWMSMSEKTLSLLSGMGKLVRQHGKKTQPLLAPIDVGKGLVSIHDSLPNWTKRTTRLSANAIRIREVLKRAKDPNALIFDDLPSALAEEVDDKADVVERLGDGLNELVKAYDNMLSRLQILMLDELQVPNISDQSLAELHARSNNARNLSGDFNLEAFVGRLSAFDGSRAGFESIASLAISKPPKSWVDPDLDRAAIELADLSQRFLRAETFARVKGRKQSRQAMAVMVGKDGAPMPAFAEFAVTAAQRPRVSEMVNTIEAALNGLSHNDADLVLAALAEISMKYMEKDEPALAIAQ